MRALLLAAACLVLAACSKPEPPTLSPKRATVTSVTAAALGLGVTIDATNPNAVDISAGNVTAHVVLDKHIEVGAATVEQSITLPANQTTELELAVSVPWNDVLPLAALATSDRRWFPYSIDGTMSLGGDLVSVSVPFHMEGNVSREQITRATLNSIPSIPGLTAPMASDSGSAPVLPPILPPSHRGAPRVFH